MKIAITGVTGVVGRTVALELAEHELCFLGRSAERLNRAFPDSRTIETDYSLSSLERGIDGSAAVVHLAAERPTSSLRMFDDFYRANVRTTENLFRACAAQGVSNVVLASTGSVYSTQYNRVPFDEDQVVFPS